MPKERHKAVPAVYLLLRDERRRILLMRRKNANYYNGWYSVPAGHMEKGELPIEALIREVAEEIGISIKLEDVKFVHIMYRTEQDETGDRVDLFFETGIWDGKIKNTEPHKCDDIYWFSLGSLPENTMHHVEDAIVFVENGVLYSQFSLEDIVLDPT